MGVQLRQRTEGAAPAPPAPAPPSTRTGAGVALQVTWLTVVAYSTWAAVALPPHPEPPVLLGAALTVVGLAVPATAGGLLLRRRWALWTSTALTLPMAALAVMCVVVDGGDHWVAEAVLAVAVLVGSLHPASWRMHTR